MVRSEEEKKSWAVWINYSMPRGERCTTQNRSRKLVVKNIGGYQISETTIDLTEWNNQKKKWS
jgi:hypothetical protein